MPPTTSPPPNARTNTPPIDLPRSIGFFGGAAIMIGVTIGSGIFQYPPVIARYLDSPALILLFWTLGGLLCLCGAFAYAELATMFPRSGGVYVFLREGFGRLVAFVFGWTYLLMTKPFAAAGIAIVCAEHINKQLGVNWDTRVETCVLLAALTIVNTFRVRLGAGIAVIFTALKMLALLMIVVLGLLLMKNAAGDLTAPLHQPLLPALAPVMLAVLWSYDGWSDVGSIAGEIRDPQRLLPRIFFAGTTAVILLYVAANAVFMWVVPLPEMIGEKTIAPLVMGRLLGPTSEKAVTIMIIISTAGATHAAIITGARVTFAQARDGLLFRFLGYIHPQHATPVVSLWAQLLLSIIAVWLLQSFEKLAEGFTFTMWIFYALAAVALLILRRTRPDHPRTYRCWGYPAVPIVFILSAAVVIALTIRDSPRQNLTYVAILLLGVPAYFIWQFFVRAPRTSSGSL